MNHFVIAKIRDNRAFGRVADTETDDETERKHAVDKALTELRTRGKIRVNVQWLVIHRQRTKKHIVHFGHGASQLVLDAHSDRKIFKISSGHIYPADRGP